MIYLGPFLRSYDSALAHPLLSLSRLQRVSLSRSSCVSPVELTDGREGGSGRGAKSYGREKALFKHSILSVTPPLSLLPLSYLIIAMVCVSIHGEQ